MFGGARQHCFIIKPGIRSDEKKSTEMHFDVYNRDKTVASSKAGESNHLLRNTNKELFACLWGSLANDQELS